MWIRRIAVFFGALILYLICLDHGASLWDCPEYILTAWRLEVGHPPGNPTWQLIANVVSHLGGSANHAAIIINGMSAVAMALAALFLSGITYLLLRASFFRGHARSAVIWANVCAGCSALCYAWCDSAIFSAVEAEVYALSAMFTALMILLALKWAVKRKEGNISSSRRYIILIFYLSGLGVGVHELNFLVLPVILLIFIYGYRSYPLNRTSKRGLIPVRTDGLPTFLWSFMLFCIGASTYLIIPIRAAANPPINQGDPSNWQRFRAYYGRYQYGSKPLLYGRTPYSYPLLREVYDPETQNYDYSHYFLEESSEGRKEYVYPDELNMWFPRMTSSNPLDIEFYEKWTGMTPDRMVPVEAAVVVDSAGTQLGRMNPATGEREMKSSFRPTHAQQLRYLMKYQVGFMYGRYLLWNFSGRQNNHTSRGGNKYGNFITGIPAIDKAMLGEQALIYNDNVGHNRYFMIPLLFGLIGCTALLFLGKEGRRVCLIIATFFLFTGVLIVVYLNQDPGEPRDRDYSFLGSFMAYTIWIGAGMAAFVKPLLKLRLRKAASRYLVRAMAALVCALIPLEMLSQTYDDHNRSNMRNAEDMIEIVLEGVEPGAIVFAEGDNIIFPLWYAQEVLGIRRDLTIIAVPYLSCDWYRKQLRRQGEGAPPVKLNIDVPPGKGPSSRRAYRDIVIQNMDSRPLYSARKIGPAEKIDSVP